MNTYFSTFITGFDEVIKKSLPESLKAVEIVEVFDGLIMYKTSSSLDEIKRVKYLNNSFVLLSRIKPLSDAPIKQMIKSVLKDSRFDNNIRDIGLKKESRFRVRASIENQFVAIDNNLLRNIEEKISRLSRLILDRSLPDVEILFTTRREGFGLVGLRFTRRSNYEKTLEKGELYPELANLLCLISEPSKDDVFLDPFCGWGSIPMQRMTSFPYRQVLAGDIDPKLVSVLKNKVAKLHQKMEVGKWDAINLANIKSGSIDKIVTDPPWGLNSGKTLNLPEFYSKMLKEFYRITKNGGIIVILTAQKELIESELAKLTDRFKLESQLSTLVSGKKAGVYKLRKLESP